MSKTILAAERNNIIYESTFENGQLNMGCSGNCPTVTTKYARAGSHSMESYLNRNTSPTNFRTEGSLASRLKFSWDVDYWIGFSVLFPDSWENPAGIGEIVWQIHSSGSGHGGPPVAVYTGNGTWNVGMRYEQGTGYAMKSFNLGSIQNDVGKWTDWVIHYRPSKEGNGVFEVWKDGVYGGKYTGNTTYSDDVGGPYFKMGIYKWPWKNLDCCGGTSPEYRVYHDELRIAKGPNAQYSDVAPGGVAQTSNTSTSNTTSNTSKNNTSTTNTTNTTNTFAIGNRVKVSADGARLAIRDTDGTRLGAQNDGALGTIT
ncbi:polysaccharide lyase, partial [Candidatus Kaiserbacteria bacterium]|nr:polysaccharide lyase [Candidatus Kaiserbacteria bacterium]